MRTLSVGEAAGLKFNRALVCALLLLCGFGGPSTGAYDLDGKPFDPLAQKAPVATVLLFVSNDCPISNRYVPEILRLRDAYAPRGVKFWLIHADPAETAASIREHDTKFNLTIPSLRDPHHYLAKLAQAEVTPSAAVFNVTGALLYHGRIDDRVTELQRERPTPNRRDLAEALDAVLAGHPVSVVATPAIGCFIPSAQ